MVERHKAKKANAAGGDYFPDAGLRPVCIPTGCTLLDCVLGGGYPLGRIINIVGDKSTGKTLLAIEACANFARKFPKGKLYYREAEAAFDVSYAEKVGLPQNRVDFGPKGTATNWRTIEDIFSDLRGVVEYHNKHQVEGVYVIDSLDALTSRAALKRDPGEGSFNLEKQKILAQLFEQLVQEFKSAKLTIIIVSQIREKIGFVLGDKYRRSGGKSLDFYASHIFWLAHLKRLVRTLGGEKRVTGVLIKANCTKNKIAEPFRECTFPIRFAYGVDDVTASLEWLAEKKLLPRLGIKVKEYDDYLDELDELNNAEYAKRAAQIQEVVVHAWEEVEAGFRPTRRKYE